MKRRAGRRIAAAVAFLVSLVAPALLVNCDRPAPATTAFSDAYSLFQTLALDGQHHLEPVRILDEIREAVVSAPSASLSLPVTGLERGRRLAFAYGISSGKEAHRNRVVYDFAVFWREKDGVMRRLFNRTTRNDTRWFDAEISLDDLAARTGELIFLVTADSNPPADDQRPPGMPAWGDARIIGADALGATDRPSVLWVTIDTVRADHVGAYGYERNTTPFIDRLAGRGVLFTSAFAHSPWTVPSTWAMMRSRYYDETDRERRDSLPEVLRAAGYTSLAWIGNSAVPGYDIGFSRYFLTDDEDIPSRFKTWLDAGGHKPFFAYIHLLGAHLPYSYRPRFSDAFIETQDDDPLAIANRENLLARLPDESVDRLIRLYDGEILASDRIAEELVESLENRGLLDNTYIVVTSDHGEEFWEHGGFEHGHSFYDELLRVPLVLVPPGWKTPRTVSGVVEQVRIAPTLLEAVGVSVPGSFRGRPLGLTGDDRDSGVVYFADLFYPKLFYELVERNRNFDAPVREFDQNTFGLRSTDYKSVVNRRGEVVQLFDLRADPRELRNLAADPAALAASRPTWDAFQEWVRSESGSCGAVHLRLTSDAAARWTVIGDSDRTVAPIMTASDMRKVNWKRDPEGLHSEFAMSTAPGDSFTLKVNQWCAARRLSLRILLDGEPLSADRVRVRNPLGDLSLDSLLENVTTEKARAVLNVPPGAETPESPDTRAELWTTVDPLPRLNPRLDDADKVSLEALRSLGYLQ